MALLIYTKLNKADITPVPPVMFLQGTKRGQDRREKKREEETGKVGNNIIKERRK